MTSEIDRKLIDAGYQVNHSHLSDEDRAAMRKTIFADDEARQARDHASKRVLEIGGGVLVAAAAVTHDDGDRPL